MPMLLLMDTLSGSNDLPTYPVANPSGSYSLPQLLEGVSVEAL